MNSVEILVKRSSNGYSNLVWNILIKCFSIQNLNHIQRKPPKIFPNTIETEKFISNSIHVIDILNRRVQIWPKRKKTLKIWTKTFPLHNWFVMKIYYPFTRWKCKITRVLVGTKLVPSTYKFAGICFKIPRNLTI